jgi:hypothetical protein
MTKIFDAKKYKEIEVFYSDIDKNMTKNYKSDMSLIINNADVAQALSSLVLTKIGSVPFRPNFGTDIDTILFENMGLIQADRIRNRIETAVKSFEPRVTLDNINVIPDYENNIYDIYIYYSTIYDKTKSYKLFIPIQSYSGE